MEIQFKFMSSILAILLYNSKCEKKKVEQKIKKIKTRDYRPHHEFQFLKNFMLTYNNKYKGYDDT